MATIFATGGVLRRSDNSKIVFGRGSTPDPAEGAYDASPDHLFGWEEDTPSHSSLPRRFWRLASRRLELDAFGLGSEKMQGPQHIQGLEAQGQGQ